MIATLPATHFTEILVATDFSDEANKALAYAKAIAHRNSGELLLLHVAQPPVPSFVPEGEWINDEKILRMQEERTEAAGQALRAEGLRAKSICSYGAVTDEVARQAGHSHADLAVFGTHARQGLSRWFLGSNAESIASRLSIPALIVGPRAPILHNTDWKPGNILCLASMNAEGASIAAYACMLADECNASIAIAYEGTAGAKDSYEGWHSFITRIDSLLTKGTHRPRMDGILLDPPELSAFIDITIARNIDLIVTGVHTRTFRAPDQTADHLPQLFAQAPCPILTVHGDAHP